MTFSINDTKHDNALQYAECRIFYIIMLNAIMLSVIMLNVVILRGALFGAALYKNANLKTR